MTEVKTSIKEKKILLVSPSPFGVNGHNMQIYNFLLNLVNTGSKCKLAVLCTDLNIGFNKKCLETSTLPYINNYPDSNIFKNIRFYSSDENKIWFNAYNLCQYLGIDQLILNTDLTLLETYCYPKLSIPKTLILSYTNINPIKCLEQLVYFDEIITLNESVKNQLNDWGYKSTFLKPIINTDIFNCKYDSEEIKSSFGIKKDSFVIFVIARNDRNTLLEQIIKAYSKFTEGKEVVIYLHTEMKGIVDIHKITSDLGISDQVFYTDEKSIKQGLSHELLSKFYNMADVVVNPYINNNVATSILCAQSCLVPVITCNNISCQGNIFTGELTNLDNYEPDLLIALEIIFNKKIYNDKFPHEIYDSSINIKEYKKILKID